MSRKYAIFDLDGTLIDTVPDILSLVNGFLAKKGYAPLKNEVGKQLLGLGSHVLVEKMCALAGMTVSDAEIETIYEEWLSIYGNAPMDKTKTFNGVYDTLTALRAAGCKTAICTNKPPKPAAFIIDKLKLRPLFDVILDADSLPQRKPDPAPLLEAVRRMGGNIDESVMIGDSEPDAEAAKNANIPVILMTYGYALRPYEDIPCAARTNDFRQLPALFSIL